MSSQKPPPLPMLPWWPGDYLGATRGFTLAERGAYCDLLFLSWLNGPLPDDPTQLARMIGVAPKQFLVVWVGIKLKFTVTDAGLVNERLERERRKSQGLREKYADRAKAAARGRWPRPDATSNASSISNGSSRDASSIENPAPHDATSNASSIRQAMLEECPPSSSPSSAPNTHKSEETNGKASAARQRILKVLKDKTCSTFSDSEVARTARVTVEEVQQVRAAQ